MPCRLAIFIFGILGLSCQENEVAVGTSCYHENCITRSLSGELLVCNGLGACTRRIVSSTNSNGAWYCACSDGAVSFNGHCILQACLIDPTSSTVCTEMMILTHQNCTYNEVFVHGKCVPRECVYDGIECNGRGICKQGYGDSYRCKCDDDMHYLPDYGCVPIICIGDSSTPCKGGICAELLAGLYSCECPSGTIFAGSCGLPECIESIEKGVCSRVGICTDSCQCPYLHIGKYCERCVDNAQMITGVCISNQCIDSNGLICSARGICVQRDKGFYCVCNENYISLHGTMCIHRNCVQYQNSSVFCSGHGDCIDNRCACIEGWWGDFCELPAASCPGPEIFVDGSCYPRACVSNGAVCNGHGTCINASCTCYTYAVSHPKLLCYPSNCIIQEDDLTILCLHGECIYEGAMLGYQCRCHNGYHNVNHSCVLAACINDLSTPNTLCNDIGICDPTFGCICPRSATGKYCSFKVNNIVNLPFSNTSSNRITCNPGFVLINKTCFPDACITGNMEICFNNRGYCINTKEYGWGCKCYSHYMGPTCSRCSSKGVIINDICTPNKCANPLLSGEYVECGGHGLCNISFVPGEDTFSGSELIICNCDDSSYPINSTCISNNCITTKINDNSGDFIICSNHGVCEIEKCLCYDEFDGPYCSYRKDIVCDEDSQLIEGQCVPQRCIFENTVCNYHGICTLLDSGTYGCKCNENFILTVKHGCQPIICVSSDGSLCKDGDCIQVSPLSYDCICKEGYKASHGECHPRECVDPQGNLCSIDRGHCIYDIHFNSFKCECLDGYGGVFCAQCSHQAILVEEVCIPPQCYIRDGDDIYVCGGFGYCVHQYRKKSYCVCDEDAAIQFNGQCASKKCVSPNSKSSMACSGVGTCINERCICTSIFYGQYCEMLQPYCGPNKVFIKTEGTCVSRNCLFNETVCGGYGQCIDGEDIKGKSLAFCSCAPGYALYNRTVCISPNCIINKCICPNGQCTNNKLTPCICNTNFTWTGSECTHNMCLNGKDMYGNYMICSGRGICDSKHGCLCNALYEGKLCEGCGRQGVLVNGTCFPSPCMRMRNSAYIICDNYGTCKKTAAIDGIDTYQCNCRHPYVDIGDGGCYSPLCIQDFTTRLICSGHGFCDGGHCICNKGYRGRRCEYKS